MATGIPVADVQKVVDDINVLIAREALQNPPPNPPDPVVPPSVGAASPDGTTIIWPTHEQLVDAAGHVWSFSNTMQPQTAHNPGPDYDLLMDGAPPPYGGAGKSLTIQSGVVRAITDNRWGRLVYQNTGTGWTLIEGIQ